MLLGGFIFADDLDVSTVKALEVASGCISGDNILFYVFKAGVELDEIRYGETCFLVRAPKYLSNLRDSCTEKPCVDTLCSVRVVNPYPLPLLHSSG